MPTDSFEKVFIVRDEASLKLLEEGLAHPRVVKIIKRGYMAESARGIETLKQRLSTTKTC